MARDYTALAEFFPDTGSRPIPKRPKPDPVLLAAAEERQRVAAEKYDAECRADKPSRCRASEATTAELRAANAAVRAIKGW